MNRQIDSLVCTVGSLLIFMVNDSDKRSLWLDAELKEICKPVICASLAMDLLPSFQTCAVPATGFFGRNVSASVLLSGRGTSISTAVSLEYKSSRKYRPHDDNAISESYHLHRSRCLLSRSLSRNLKRGLCRSGATCRGRPRLLDGALVVHKQFLRWPMNKDKA